MTGLHWMGGEDQGEEEGERNYDLYSESSMNIETNDISINYSVTGEAKQSTSVRQ